MTYCVAVSGSSQVAVSVISVVVESAVGMVSVYPDTVGASFPVGAVTVHSLNTLPAGAAKALVGI